MHTYSLSRFRRIHNSDMTEISTRQANILHRRSLFWCCCCESIFVLTESLYSIRKAKEGGDKSREGWGRGNGRCL